MVYYTLSMSLINALIQGIVEGITEFIPVSSTAHLIITSKFLHIPQTDFQKFFEVFIQSGAILAVVFLYFGYVLKHRKVQLNVILSFLPTAVVGYFLFSIIKNVFFESTGLIIAALIIVGLVFIVLEYLVKSKRLSLNKTLANINWQHAVLIGLAQSLAVVPGVSRAGIVIVAMMLLGYKREDSAIYSFLLAVPTILAASALDLFKMRGQLAGFGQMQLYVVIGFVVSFITAYFSVKWLIDYLKKNSLTSFGLYRIVLAIIVMLLLGS